VRSEILHRVIKRTTYTTLSCQDSVRYTICILKAEGYTLLPTKEERLRCANGEGSLCHAIAETTGNLAEYSTRQELDQVRQRSDWVSNHCQTAQCSERKDRLELPCFKLRETIFNLNE